MLTAGLGLGLQSGGYLEPAGKAAEALASVLERRLRELPGEPPLSGQAALCCTSTVNIFYQRRGHAPAWSDGRAVGPDADALLDFLPQVIDDGLNPGDYCLVRLRELRSRIPAWGGGPRLIATLADLDLLLTDAWLLLGSHLLSGKLNPETIDPEWFANRRGGDLAARLETALAEHDCVGELRRLRPQQPGYSRLGKVLAAWRVLEAGGGWPAVPGSGWLQRGDAGDRVSLLRARLAVEDGELLQAPRDTFGAALEAGVRRFQRRYGLEIDGVVGPATLAALNVPVDQRMRQIEANLERWRWLPADLGSTHVLVNIADQRLELRQDGRTVLDMAVIVGRSYRRTPVFTGLLTYIVFSPVWEVPPRLAVQDKLPELQADPQQLIDQGFQVISGRGTQAHEIDILSVDWLQATPDDFPYRLRQLPGPQNALGRVKFMLPNKFNVYLHDTPSRELFRRTGRTFSSGCIRIEDPEGLAGRLLADRPEWTAEAIRAAMDANVERTVVLHRPCPVHLLYWTAWVAEDGQVHFRPDIYGRDRLLLAALAKEAPTVH